MKTLFLICLLFPFLSFALEDVEMDLKDEDIEKKTEAFVIEQFSENFLTLADHEINYDGLKRFEKDLDLLRKIVGETDLGDLPVKQTTDQINEIDNLMSKLPKKLEYKKSEINKIRKKADELIRQPVTNLYLSKYNIMEGKKAMLGRRYPDAHKHFDLAIIFMGKLPQKISQNMETSKSKIESELVILKTASIIEQQDFEKKLNSIADQLLKAFNTYSDTVFNMWSDKQHWQRP